MRHTAIVHNDIASVDIEQYLNVDIYQTYLISFIICLSEFKPSRIYARSFTELSEFHYEPVACFVANRNR